MAFIKGALEASKVAWRTSAPARAAASERITEGAKKVGDAVLSAGILTSMVGGVALVQYSLLSLDAKFAGRNNGSK